MRRYTEQKACNITNVTSARICRRIPFANAKISRPVTLVLVLLLWPTGSLFAQDLTEESLKVATPVEQVKQVKQIEVVEAAAVPISKPVQTSGARPKVPQLVETNYSYFPWAGETLYYSIGFNGIEGMRAKVQIGKVKTRNGLPYVALAGSIQSVGFLSSIYSVDDKAESYINPYSNQVYQSKKHFEEGGITRIYEVDYYPVQREADVKAVRTGVEQTFIRHIPLKTNDMFSWFFELRRMYPLQVGEPLKFYIYDGWKLSRIRGEVLGLEDRLTPMGWFKTYHLRLVRDVIYTYANDGKDPIEEDAKPAEHTFDLWVSRDENMLPVEMHLSTPWGTGELTIIKWRPADDFKKPKPDRSTWRRVQKPELKTEAAAKTESTTPAAQ